MLKITLLILFCAILGDGISGQTHDRIETNVPSKIAEKVQESLPTRGNLNTNTNDSNSTQPLLAASKDTSLTSSNATVSQMNTIVSNAAAIQKEHPVLPNTTIIENNNKSINILADQSMGKSVENDSNQVIEDSDTSNNIIKDAKPETIQTPSIASNPATTVPPTSIVPTAIVPPLNVPAPKPGKWMLNGTNETCIIINMAVQFHVFNATVSNQTTYKVFNLPNNTNEVRVSGSCGKLEQFITLEWKNETVNVTNTFTLHFTKNETTKEYSFHHLKLNITETKQASNFVHNGTLFSTGLSSSYRCLKQQNFTFDSNKTNDYLIMSDLQFQAFKADKTTNFGEAKDCKLDTPDIVPIAVGCALAGLVVIVLIAYLVGRKRSQSRGYLSM